jgi:hypothetical protein
MIHVVVVQIRNKAAPDGPIHTETPMTRDKSRSLPRLIPGIIPSRLIFGDFTRPMQEDG